jgi:DNA-binding NarL/FixJ family response regulator
MTSPAQRAERLDAARRAWGLTPRQERVVELLLTGATNKQIAYALRCAEVTVENHLTGVYRRSGANSRTDLVCRVFAQHSVALLSPTEE